ncbi:hypothetical protein D3C72_1386250 [compost metagenome]
MQDEDDDAEDGRGGHRVAPDRIAHMPRVEQQRQQQVGTDCRVPHALPGIEAALELDRREFGQHGHGDGEVDAVRCADEEAADQDHIEAGREHHQQRADHGQHLGQDQRAHAAPTVGHPAAQRVEDDGDPRGERGQQRHLRGGKLQIARHRPKAGAQCGIGESVKEESAEGEPPHHAGAATYARTGIYEGDDIVDATKLDGRGLHGGLLFLVL